MMAVDALSAWDLGSTRPVPADGGLINATWWLEADDGTRPYVLQRLNTGIFRPTVHADIEVITGRLSAAGIPTPRLARTTSGNLWYEASDGSVWRVLSTVGNRTIARPADATVDELRSAAQLLARVHAALVGHTAPFAFERPGAHDTDAHVAAMVRAADAASGHRLADAVRPLAASIAEGWARWDGPKTLPKRVIHGDLKISNVRFDGDRAVALIDLDTWQWGTLDVEWGDALRSWCNVAGEDAPQPQPDGGRAIAALRAYTAAAPDALADEARRGGLPGMERIAWELASRFARDVVEECYFGFDPRFGGRGEHNLIRARSQAALASEVASARGRWQDELERRDP